MVVFDYQMANKDFPEWLQNQLDEKGWNQADLVKRSKVTSAQISRLINGTRDPGPDVLNAIAKALKIPPETVFRAAGLLPEVEERDVIGQLTYLLNMLDDENLLEVLNYARYRLDLQEKNQSSRSERPARSASSGE